MQELLLAAVSAFSFGIMTSISPCPLATNILAISFIDRQIGKTRMVLFSGLLYSLGRMIAYIAVAAIILNSIMATEVLSHFLQKYMNKILGPLLVLVGMILLELLSFNIKGPTVTQNMTKRLESLPLIGSFLLGIVFALSFCPISAALFFINLITISINYKSSFLMPALYGLGTALPVFAFAVIIAFGAKALAKAFNKLKKIEFWIRRATGIIFVIIGIYYCLTHIFGLIT
ncbi:MAG: aromatic aminobenezylarsenical efflux permease ArsG family transporter [Planctomycetota bacterium]|jgi:cytochrome c biogenesis protein CcdA